MYGNFVKYFDFDTTQKAVFSRPMKHRFVKTTVKPVVIKGHKMWQVEDFDGTKAFHTNLDSDELLSYVEENLSPYYEEINLIKTAETVVIRLDKNGKVKVRSVASENKVTDMEHNKHKNYLLEEGTAIEPLVDLGVFDKDYKIVKAMYSKYKQINKFIEIIDHELKDVGTDGFTILDFGSGKSYLTFITYYYFTFIKKNKVKIIGYDLKEDVVENCNKIAKRYGYEGLHFLYGDIAKAEVEKVDMVITLHACDTATDYALNYAIRQGVKYIFSVPCCQHEVNAQIKADGGYAIITEHGLIKERFAALLTDAMRAEILKTKGYDVDVVEFVDFSHSPKNLMIRAVKNRQCDNLSDNKKLAELSQAFSINQKLMDLLKG